MYEELLSAIASKKLKPVYFLTGDEDYMIDSLMRQAELSIIPLEEKDFNQQVLYGKEITIRQVIENCRQRPFVGNQKLVLVKEAQDIKNWDEVLVYLKQPVNYTVLFIAYKNKKPDGRSAWVKALKEKAVYFESKQLYESQLAGFIKGIASKNKLNLDQEAVILMAEYLGNNLAQIENEIEKIKLISNGKDKISADLVSQYIGISRENNVFELSKALSLKDKKKIYSIMDNISKNMKSNPLLGMISSLFNHFQKVYITKYHFKKSDNELASLLKLSFASYLKEYREAAQKYSTESLQKIIALLKEYDLKAKGLGAANVNESELFREMILKINQV